MKKLIALLSAPTPVAIKVEANHPNFGYYGGLLNQGAYGK